MYIANKDLRYENQCFIETEKDIRFLFNIIYIPSIPFENNILCIPTTYYITMD